MARKRIEPVKLEGVELIFKNFGGRPDAFNLEGGKRYFHIILDPEVGNKLVEEGWNVKVLRDKMGEEPDQPHIKVNVNMKSRTPPRCVLITPTANGDARTTLTEDMLEILDAVDIANVDVIFNPYQRTPDSPVTAYLKTIFVKARLDELELKYADVPELEFNAPLQIEAGPADDDMLEGEVLEDTEGWN